MRHGSNSKGEARWVASDITTGLVVATRAVAPQPEERERERRERAKGRRQIVRGIGPDGS